MQSVFNIADRVAMVHKGRIIDVTTPDELRSSQNPYIQQFINGRPLGPIDFFKEDIGIGEIFGL
jgi:phospholipid/cholesterol/gamma-HCH transport system ATP-binding protein